MKNDIINLITLLLSLVIGIGSGIALYATGNDLMALIVGIGIPAATAEVLGVIRNGR